MSTNSEKETIFLPNGDNLFEIADRTARIYAGAGNDQITLGTGEYEVFADGGNNSLTVKSQETVIHTGDGDDRFILDGLGPYTIYAGNGNNQLSGTGLYGVTFYSGTGKDVVSANSIGPLLIDAGDGDNEVSGGGWRSTVSLRAGAGNDKLRAQSFNTDVQAGAGNNDIATFSGSNTNILAGDGDDRITFAASGAFGGDPGNTINAGHGNNTLSGYALATRRSRWVVAMTVLR